MKISLLSAYCFIAAILFIKPSSTHAQSAGDYMNGITSEFNNISTQMWDYTSAVGHGKSARKIENRRKDVLQAISGAQSKIQKMPAFQGDRSLRDSTLSYLKLSYHVINFDYGKIVDMEAIAEDSYDKMEAYLTAQQQASEKIKQAGEMFEMQQKLFASSHNINLIEDKDKISLKLEEAEKVFAYYNRLYLIFFKPFKEEAYLLDAMSKSNVDGMKKNIDNLNRFSDDGLKAMDSVEAFSGDNSLKVACTNLLTFYKTEASKKGPLITNFYANKEDFLKKKTAIEAKSEHSRTKADVDEYNKAVADFNKSTDEYNALNQELNAKRTDLINKWNEAVSNFLDKHVPKHK